MFGRLPYCGRKIGVRSSAIPGTTKWHPSRLPYPLPYPTTSTKTIDGSGLLDGQVRRAVDHALGPPLRDDLAIDGDAARDRRERRRAGNNRGAHYHLHVDGLRVESDLLEERHGRRRGVDLGAGGVGVLDEIDRTGRLTFQGDVVRRPLGLLSHRLVVA